MSFLQRHNRTVSVSFAAANAIRSLEFAPPASESRAASRPLAVRATTLCGLVVELSRSTKTKIRPALDLSAILKHENGRTLHTPSVHEKRLPLAKHYKRVKSHKIEILWPLACSTISSRSYVFFTGGPLETFAPSSFASHRRSLFGLSLGRRRRSEGHHSERLGIYSDHPNKPESDVRPSDRHYGVLREYPLPDVFGRLRVPGFPESDRPDDSQLDDRNQRPCRLLIPVR